MVTLRRKAAIATLLLELQKSSWVITYPPTSASPNKVPAQPTKHAIYSRIKYIGLPDRQVAEKG